MGREAAIVFTGEGARVCVADLDVALAEETVTMCDGDAFAFGAQQVEHAYRREDDRRQHGCNTKCDERAAEERHEVGDRLTLMRRPPASVRAEL